MPYPPICVGGRARMLPSAVTAVHDELGSEKKRGGGETARDANQRGRIHRRAASVMCTHAASPIRRKGGARPALLGCHGRQRAAHAGPERNHLVYSHKPNWLHRQRVCPVQTTRPTSPPSIALVFPLPNFRASLTAGLFCGGRSDGRQVPLASDRAPSRRLGAAPTCLFPDAVKRSPAVSLPGRTGRRRSVLPRA